MRAPHLDQKVRVEVLRWSYELGRMAAVARRTLPSGTGCWRVVVFLSQVPVQSCRQHCVVASWQCGQRAGRFLVQACPPPAAGTVPKLLHGRGYGLQLGQWDMYGLADVFFRM